MFNKRWALIGALVIAITLFLAACGAETIVQTVVVTEIVEGEVVEKIVEVTPVPEVEVKDTVIICMSQEPDSLYTVTTNMAVSTQVLNTSDLMGWFPDRGFFYETHALVNNEFPTFDSGDVVVEDNVMSVTYRFKPELTWSDGEPFSVDDILFTREVVIDPDSGAVSRGILDQMVFEKIDDFTLKVTYPEGVMDPLYFQPPLSSQSGTATLPEHVLGDMAPIDIIESEWARMPNPVLGPYEYVEWVEGDHITMKRVEDWWGNEEFGKPAIETVVWRFIADTNALLAAVLSGDCDHATSDGLQATQLPFIQQSADRGLIKYDAIPSTVWEHIDMNNYPTAAGVERDGLAFFADKRVRYAVGYGTDRLTMTEQILYGEVQPLTSYLPSDHWAWNPETEGLYSYDPEQAKALLEEAGWVEGEDGFRTAGQTLTGTYDCDRGEWSIPAGTPFEVEFHTTTGNAMREQLSQIFQSNMADIGLKINLDLIPSTVWFGADGPLRQRRFQIGEFAWVADADPGAFWLYASMNVLQTSDGEFILADDLLEQQPDFLTGSGLTRMDFAFQAFDTEWLPEGYSVIGWEMIPDEGDTWEGGNRMGWCNTAATMAAFNGEFTVIAPEDRLPFYLEFQKLFVEDLPSLPLFQRLEVEASAVDLCGPDRGPANSATLAWNIYAWHFGDCEE